MFYHPLFQDIEQEHGRWVDLMEDLLAATDPSDRRARVARLKLRLVPHLKAEERHLYPVLKTYPRLKDLVLLAIEEHHIGLSVLRDLERMSGEEENWAAKVAALQDILERHAESEENLLLAGANDALSPEAADTVRAAFVAEQDRLRDRLQEGGGTRSG
jgi:hemerythrin-like domain-containing protein